MTQEHPITPPPELVEDWIEIAKPLPQRPPNPGELATLAARWGADQELEALLTWLKVRRFHILAADLLAARRPEPLSLKEEALDALENLNGECLLEGFECPEKVATIRRALESLPD